MSGNTFRWGTVIVSLLLGVYALLPTFLDSSDGKLDGQYTEEVQQTWGPLVLDYVEPLTLGLDLQGGLLLQYNVLVDKAIQDELDQKVRAIEDVLKDKDEDLVVDVKHPVGATYVEVAFEDAAKGALLNEDFMNSNFPSMRLLDQGSGSYRMVLRDDLIEEKKKNVVQSSIERIRDRVDALGVAEPSITRRGESDIVVQLPGLPANDAERVERLIGQTAQLQFRMLDGERSNDFFTKFRGKLPVGFDLRRVDGNSLSVTHSDKEALRAFFKDKVDDQHIVGFEFFPVYEDPIEKTTLDREKSYWKSYYVFSKVELTGDMIEDAQVAIDQQFNKPYVAITFKPDGAKLFGDLSASNVGKRMSIMLDDVIKSAPVFEEAIRGGNARITMGSMQSFGDLQRDAQDLVIVLDHGALPAPLEKQFETVVGPSLGQDSIDSSTRALLWGSLLVILFMGIYYRGGGVISVLALVMNIVFIFAVLAVFGATLTLPGIAGIILTVGMAVDANVIIFERIREELLAGSKARDAVAQGYGKAFSAVMDANITTGIAGLVLLQFGTGPIKGFAVTLLIGIVGTIFTAVFISRLIFDSYVTGDRASSNELSI